MRLLHLNEHHEITFAEFIGKHIPPYAILSHTWGPASEEVSYADFVAGTHKDKPGFRKILNCGKQTARDGLQFFWIDTCCINKDSSAELTEAINSMYTWYRLAELCYAYLSDVRLGEQRFFKSRWFERGWTLQELLAPADVLFFDADWSAIGYKTSLTTTISDRTGINSSALQDGTALETFSIAERMSWAANRQTTRVEDEAYCLLGLFDVNMPLIYGEGRKAFVRLQEELLLKSDASVFAYVSLKPSNPPGATTIRITDHSNGPIISEEYALGNDPADEEQIVNTVGLYSTSPTFFREAARYLPYPVAEVVLKHPNSRPWPALSGHRVKIQTALWKIPIEQLQGSHLSESSVQDAIFKAHGIKLSLSSIRKLCQCVHADNMADWRIAFLDCRRRAGGVVGIVVEESRMRGTYIRRHFPSLVETESLHSFRPNNSIESIGLIYIEGDSLRIDPNRQNPFTQTGLLQPSSNVHLNNQTILRAVNLHDYGFSKDFSGTGRILQHAVFCSSNPAIPKITLTAQIGYQRTSTVFVHGNEQGVLCELYPNTSSGHSSFIEIGREPPSDTIFVPSYRGSTTHVPLTRGLHLMIKSQMQWKHENTFRYADRIRKQCLLSLSIVPTAEFTGKLLQDPVSQPALLNALSRHLTLPAARLQ